MAKLRRIPTCSHRAVLSCRHLQNQPELLAALRKSESVPQFGNANSRPFSGADSANSAAVNEAIRSLKPWLANEVSLTEENAKECCAVLVDSLAPKARAADRREFYMTSRPNKNAGCILPLNLTSFLM